MFNVPVHVEVDEARKAVVSVKVDDEHAAAGPAYVLGEGSEGDAGLLARGAAIAEAMAWPMWELGL